MKLEGIFCDLNPPLNAKQAEVEANRCYYCYDAPCIQACPTGIDIPSFIRKIGNGNTRGAAMDILSANIMGGTCARACPVETLCQQACVREHSEKKPVEIGKLQRFATDAYFEEISRQPAKIRKHPFPRAASTGQKVAIVGAGPAGLSCAHKLATLGHEVTVFEAKPKSGGLNEYGLAPYKMTDHWASREVEFILSVGGITVQNGKTLGRDFDLDSLLRDYSAVFLAVGLGDVNALGVPGETAKGVFDAVKFIEKIRQAKSAEELRVGRRVVVIGGGNTAVDIAIQCKRLGAEFVTIAYRRGTGQMGATPHEQELAQTQGVLIKTWVKPVKIVEQGGHAQAIELEYTETDAQGKLKGTGRFLTLPADQIFKAIGQTLAHQSLGSGKSAPEIKNGKIAVNEAFETTVAGVFAGGDCIERGEDLTVTAVEHGKRAAQAIDRKLRQKLVQKLGGIHHG